MFFVSFFFTLKYYFAYIHFFFYSIFFNIRVKVDEHLSETEQDLSFAYVIFAVLTTVPFILLTNY